MNPNLNETENEQRKKDFFDYLKGLVQLRGDIDTKGIKEVIYKDMVFRGPIVWV